MIDDSTEDGVSTKTGPSNRTYSLTPREIAFFSATSNSQLAFTPRLQMQSHTLRQSLMSRLLQLVHLQTGDFVAVNVKLSQCKSL